MPAAILLAGGRMMALELLSAALLLVGSSPAPSEHRSLSEESRLGCSREQAGGCGAARVGPGRAVGGSGAKHGTCSLLSLDILLCLFPTLIVFEFGSNFSVVPAALNQNFAELSSF